MTLCCVVKDEQKTIPECLGRVIGLFDEVAITDTGSTDDTIELLRRKYGVEVTRFQVVPENYYSIRDARNFNVGLARTSHVFFLDADEYVSPDDCARVQRAAAAHPEVDGFFMEFNTYVGDAVADHDYRLSIFRSDRGIVFEGERHPTVNLSVRHLGGAAVWVGGEIRHCPPAARVQANRERYVEHLLELVERDQGFYRYHWFLGMTLFFAGRTEDALPHLATAAESKSTRFPVECLNSHMLLADLHFRAGAPERALGVIDEALAFHEAVKDDFEVKVNFRLAATLRRMRRDIAVGGELLAPYSFTR